MAGGRCGASLFGSRSSGSPSPSSLRVASIVRGGQKGGSPDEHRSTGPGGADRRAAEGWVRRGGAGGGPAAGDDRPPGRRRHRALLPLRVGSEGHDGHLHVPLRGLAAPPGRTRLTPRQGTGGLGGRGSQKARPPPPGGGGAVLRPKPSS